MVSVLGEFSVRNLLRSLFLRLVLLVWGILGYVHVSVNVLSFLRGQLSDYEKQINKCKTILKCDFPTVSLQTLDIKGEFSLVQIVKNKK